MARLGDKATDLNTENGRKFLGDKDIAAIKKESRQSIEENHNIAILFFAIDWERSKRNFYGEMTVKKFANPTGTPVRGKYRVETNSATQTHGIPKKTMKLTVSLFDDLLREQNIKPDKGDYFSVGKRFYQIYEKTIDDVGQNTVLLNREKITTDYLCYEDEDESMQVNVWGDNKGTQFDIETGGGEIL